MTPLDRLRAVARRLERERDDVRHTLLDVSRDFLQATDGFTVGSAAVQEELQELRREVESVQPRFASHRTTSSLFDREGLGRAGHDRARAVADRIIALVRQMDAAG